jgi:hypothetical protein
MYHELGFLCFWLIFLALGSVQGLVGHYLGTLNDRKAALVFGTASAALGVLFSCGSLFAYLAGTAESTPWLVPRFWWMGLPPLFVGALAIAVGWSRGPTPNP